MSKSATLQPLTCQTCGAPVPLGEGAEVQCPSCGGRQPLAPEYRAFRDARRLSAEDAKTLDELCAEVTRPDPAWKRASIIVGYGVGGFTLVVLAIGALVGAVAGLWAAANVKAEGAVAYVLVGLCTLIFGLISVPLVGEYCFFLVRLGSFDLASRMAFAGINQLNVDLGVGAILYLFSVVPIAIARKTQLNLASLEALRGKLSAQPALKGGVLGCRACGAPLTVSDGAVAARCLYCATESLVQVSRSTVKQQQQATRSVRLGLREALAERAAALAADRKQMVVMLVGGPFIAPLVCLGGILLHALQS